TRWPVIPGHPRRGGRPSPCPKAGKWVRRSALRGREGLNGECPCRSLPRIDSNEPGRGPRRGAIGARVRGNPDLVSAAFEISCQCRTIVCRHKQIREREKDCERVSFVSHRFIVRFALEVRESFHPF